jgi:ubiquinone/menaquinone biosynthesis C-methylase UbiE
MTNDGELNNKVPYVLETGGKGKTRLNLLHQVYGGETEKLLLEIGLRPGITAADIGCGPGIATCFMARHVGVTGFVVGVDASVEQLQVARVEADATGFTNVRFIEADVYAIGIEDNYFDLVYARSLLSHLQRPLGAVMEMRRIVKPGGVLVCEDIDMRNIFTEPGTPEYSRMVEIWIALGEYMGADLSVGVHMADLFRKAKFEGVNERSHQPRFNSGEKKRYWEYTLYELEPVLIKSGISTRRELDDLRHGYEKIAADESITVVQSLQTQVWARK